MAQLLVNVIGTLTVLPAFALTGAVKRGCYIRDRRDGCGTAGRIVGCIGFSRRCGDTSIDHHRGYPTRRSIAQPEGQSLPEVRLAGIPVRVTAPVELL